MAEKVVLDTAESITEWQLYRLELDLSIPAVVMWFRNDLGEQKRIGYNGDEALDLLKFVNKADFSGTNRSLVNRAMKKAVDAGHFVGTISGAELA